jgi:hypothetical protein
MTAERADTKSLAVSNATMLRRTRFPLARFKQLSQLRTLRGENFRREAKNKGSTQGNYRAE